VLPSVVSVPPNFLHAADLLKWSQLLLIVHLQKRPNKPFRIRSFKTQGLKSFRIRNYGKTGEGGDFHPDKDTSLEPSQSRDPTPSANQR
jgi:hypothetical protein